MVAGAREKSLPKCVDAWQVEVKSRSSAPRRRLRKAAVGRKNEIDSVRLRVSSKENEHQGTCVMCPRAFILDACVCVCVQWRDKSRSYASSASCRASHWLSALLGWASRIYPTIQTWFSRFSPSRRFDRSEKVHARAVWQENLAGARGNYCPVWTSSVYIFTVFLLEDSPKRWLRVYQPVEFHRGISRYNYSWSRDEWIS